MQLLARYRRHGDTSADTLEVIIEADDYDGGLTEARGRTVDGDDLLSVQVID